MQWTRFNQDGDEVASGIVNDALHPRAGFVLADVVHDITVRAVVVVNKDGTQIRYDRGDDLPRAPRARVGPLLDCGHRATPTEAFRFGPEKWCGSCQQWREVVMPASHAFVGDPDDPIEVDPVPDALRELQEEEAEAWAGGDGPGPH